MKKYIVLYRVPAELMQKAMEETKPEERAEYMKKWQDWAESLGDKLVDLGTPCGPGVSISQEGNKPANSDVAGYSIVQAEDEEAAKKLFESHPHLGWDKSCSCDLYECMPLSE